MTLPPGSLAGLCAVVLIAPITSGGADHAVVAAAATTAVVARRLSSSVALACDMAVIWLAGLAA